MFEQPRKKIIKMITEGNPSQVTESYWLYCHNPKLDYPEHTPNGGKWLIFIQRDYIDEVWQKIKAAIQKGELGSTAKVSTTRSNPLARESKSHVICVYSYDSDDVEDVMRIREKLREIGIKRKIPYKTDKAEKNGKYSIFGHKNISKYFI